MPKPKAEIMAAKRKARRDLGLVPVTVYIPPEHAQQLQRYIERTLKGEYPTR